MVVTTTVRWLLWGLCLRCCVTIVDGLWVVDDTTDLDSNSWPVRTWTQNVKERKEVGSWNRNSYHLSHEPVHYSKKELVKNISVILRDSKYRGKRFKVSKRRKGRKEREIQTVSGRSGKSDQNSSSKKSRMVTISAGLLPGQLGPGMGGSAMETPEASNLQRFATEPAPQTAVLGSIVVLPCRVINKVGQLQWTKDGFGLGNERNLDGFYRYSMIGADDEGDYSLRIQPVLLEDDGHFQCQVSASDGVPGIRSKSVQLTVHVPPEQPLVSPGELETTAGLLTTVTCRSTGGRPPPEIQWIDDCHPREPLGLGAVTTMELMPDNKRSVVTSNLSFTPRRTHDNATLTCITSNQALSAPLSSSVKLRVHFGPEVQVNVHPDRLVEGDDAHFVCQALANPHRLAYRWYHNSVLLRNQTAQTLTLPRISRDMHQDSISCEVSNKVGSSKKTLNLQVRYGPVFRSLPLDAAAEQGHEAGLRCNVDSNPSATIVWLQEGNDKIIGTGPELRVVVSPLTAGSYRCVAGVREKDLQFPELTGKMKVMIKGPPTIVSATEQMGRPGATVNLECNTVSVPIPIKVTWTYKGRVIDLEDPRYEVVEEQQKEGLRTILVIHSAEETDFGDYNCSVVNEYGIARKLIRLNEEKRVPVLLLLAGVGAVLVAMVTVAGLLFCNKKRPLDKAKRGSFCSRGLIRGTGVSGHKHRKVSFSRASPVPEKIVSTPSAAPNMYSAAFDSRLTENPTPSSTPVPRPRESYLTISDAREDLGLAGGSHTLERNRASRAREHFVENRTTTFTPQDSREDEPNVVYIPLMNLPPEHDSMRRGSLSEVSTRGSYARLPQAELWTSDFCTIRRGIRGQDLISPYHSNNGMTLIMNEMATGSGLNSNNAAQLTSEDGLRASRDGLITVVDGLTPENGIIHHMDDRYSKYTGYSTSHVLPMCHRHSDQAKAPPGARPRGNGTVHDHRHEADYIYSTETVMKPGTLV